jgi:uncharacterized protein
LNGYSGEQLGKTMSDMQAFSIPFEKSVIKGDHLRGTADVSVLTLHGAGASDRSRSTLLRNVLAEQNIGSTSFDFIGHGETGGAMGDSSLASRTRQAQAVISARVLQSPLVLVGSSMGAYNAIKLTQSNLVDALVLIVPGVFTPTAYELPFGPQFSQAIRRERSWIDSDAWGILAEFTGRLLVIAAENDAVIPREIPERLIDSAVKSNSKALYIVEGGEHTRLFSLLLERPDDYRHTMNLILDCVSPVQP